MATAKDPTGLFPHWITRGLIVLCAAIALILFCIQVRPLFETPPSTAIYGWDDTFYYAWMRSAFVGHDADFEDDIITTPTLPDALKRSTLNGPRTAIGRIPNKYPIGWSLSSAPFYIIADISVLAGRATGLTEMPRDGYSPAYQFFILLGQFAYAAGGLALAYTILRRFFSREIAMLGVALTWLTSFMLYYQAIDLTMAHSVTFFWVAATYRLTFALRDRPKRTWLWAVLGTTAAMTVLCRYQAAVYLLFPATYLIGELRPVGQGAKRIAAAALPFAALIFLQLLAWKAVYGQWLTYTYGNEGFHWLAPSPIELLFSPYHGLYYWHPMLLIGTAAFVLFLLLRRQAPRSWFVIALLMFYVNAAWETWWFGVSFGSRAFDACVLFAMVGTAWLFKNLTKHRRLAWALLAIYLVAGVWNINLARLFKKNRIHTNAPVTYTEMFRAMRKNL